MTETLKETFLKVNKIRIDGGTQNRVEINEGTVAEYAEVIGTGVQFPPVDVFYDGTEYWLADGFHRWHATRRAELNRIKVRIHKGTKRDAVLFSLGVNASHGMRRTNADKRRSVETALKDAEWGAMSDNWIAEHCAVSQPFVGSIRKKLTYNGYKSDSNGAVLETKVSNSNQQKLGRDGRAINTSNIGKTQPQKVTSEPVVGVDVDGYGRPLKQLMNDDGYDPFNDPDIDEDGAPLATQTFEQAVKNAEVIYDNSDEIKAVADMTDDEWLETLPIWRVLSQLQHRGIRLRADLIGYRKFEEHIKRFRHFVPRCFETPLDSSPMQLKISGIYKMIEPQKWTVCAPCHGHGCQRCNDTGYDINQAGIEPQRVENGEVEL